MTLVKNGNEDFIQEEELQWGFAGGGRTKFNSKCNDDKWGFTKGIGWGQ